MCSRGRAGARGSWTVTNACATRLLRSYNRPAGRRPARRNWPWRSANRYPRWRDGATVGRTRDRGAAGRSCLDASRRRGSRQTNRHETFRPAPIFSTMDFRDALGVSRKFAVPLVDYLDKIRFTVRSGNNRTPGSGSEKKLIIAQ